MFRSIKWATPVLALALLAAFTAVRANAEDKKETGSVSGTGVRASSKVSETAARASPGQPEKVPRCIIFLLSLVRWPRRPGPPAQHPRVRAPL